MTITPYEFFYDGQQRRFLEQIVRAFSGFSYQTGRQGGAPQTLLVPCELALTNRQVANIRANLSENTINTVPKITIWQSGLQGRKADLQNPAFIDHLQVFERQIVDGQYTGQRGNAYSVDRIMPLPFTMDVTVDVWTSNLEQKYQLLEQMLVATYPEFQIQNDDNPLDWTAVTICFVEDDINFSSRTIPIGVNDDIDIFSIKLRLPIWLTAPAKVRKLHRIEEIIANVGDLVFDPITGQGEVGTLYQRVIITPGEFSIAVNGNTITLLAAYASETYPDGSVPSWADLIKQYGLFSPLESQLHIYLGDIEGPYVSGVLQFGSEANQLVWTIDGATLPANTLPAVNAVIDPMRTYPGQGLPTPANDMAYMLVNDIGPSVAWGSFTAHTNDVIQYNSTLSAWQVAFNSRSSTSPQYMLNLYTGSQLLWTGTEWVMAINNFYGPGYWRLAL